jgi:phosphate transport system substrate-binding protein
MKRTHYWLCAITIPLALSVGGFASAQNEAAPWLKNYQPNAQSKKFPAGSAAERRARMAAVANSPQYKNKFDLSGLPSYTSKSKPTGTVRVCGNNYLGDSPLAKWWKAAFAKYQPGIKLEFDLPTAAIAASCLYFDKADVGVNHQLSFYDYLAYKRLKGYLPVGISVFTGSYDVIGWQNNIAIIVNKKNPLTKITMQQLDGVFGSQRAGGWVDIKWHPEFARGADQNLRTWGKLGLSGAWTDRPIDTYGYSLRYATALEFSDKVLKSSDKWNGNLLAFGNFLRPDGTTYLEGDQVLDHVKNDPNGIGYIRYHDGLENQVKILALAKTAAGPYVPYTIDTLQKRTYPLWGDQSFWLDVKPGTKLDPATYEFVRFVLSRQGQELVERDGKYLPLPADADAKQEAKLDALAAGRKVE